MSLIKWILIGIVILWLTGFVQLPILNTPLFSIFGHPFTLYNLLIIVLVGFAIRLLPGIFQTIIGILLILWILSTFIFPAFGGLANIFILILIIAVLFSIF